MPAKKDFTGQRFGKLVAIREDGKDKFGKILWYCECDCGNSITIIGEGLSRGFTKSCGCHKIIDLLNQRFGRLQVIEYKGLNKHNHATWLCKCDCGKECIVASGNLRRGNQVSCGCQGLENRVAATTTHHLSSHPLHRIWRKIKERCYNPNQKSYKNYGARGVTMCSEWKDDFKSFYDWAMLNGWKKGLQVDKDIRGTGKLYSPEMCIITTQKENGNKTRRNVYITVNNQTKTAAQWSEIVGIPAPVICRRIREGWDHKDAITVKPRYLKCRA